MKKICIIYQSINEIDLCDVMYADYMPVSGHKGSSKLLWLSPVGKTHRVVFLHPHNIKFHLRKKPFYPDVDGEKRECGYSTCQNLSLILI